MSRILVSDSSPAGSPGEDEQGIRARVLPPSSRMASAMNGAGHFVRTDFNRTLSPSRSPTLDRGTSKSATRDVIAPSLSSSSASSSKLASMAARINAKSQSALPPCSSGGARGSSSSLSSGSSGSSSPGERQDKLSRDGAAQGASIPDLQRFAYQGGNGAKRPSPAIVLDEDRDDSSHVSSEGGKTKKRRFVRGGKRAISKALDSDGDDDVQITSTKRAASSSVPADKSGEDKLMKAAHRIAALQPSWEMDQIRKALQDTRQGPSEEVGVLPAMEALKAHYTGAHSSAPTSDSSQSLTSPSFRTSGSTQAKATQRTASYLTNTGAGRPGGRPVLGKGIQVTSRSTSSSPVFVSHSKLKPEQPVTKAAPISKAMERVKSSTASARSSISLSDDSDGDSSRGSDSGYDREGREQKKALQWFNHVDEKQLMDIVGVNAEQAAVIVDLRPYSSTADVTAKLGDRSAKGVTPKLFYNCVDLMSGLHEIDSVLEKCERMGSRLNTVLEGWKSSAVVGSEDKDYLCGQPEGLSEGVQLKDFQLHGVNWLHLLYRRECSGILADDMGLGKTAQVIGFLNVIRRNRKGPHLIVVPSSVLTNWMREFALFGPELNVFKYHGSQSERMMQQRELKHERSEIDVVITTYEMASGGERDHTFLKKYEFDACIYDEGHILKNQKSIKYTKLIKIRAKWRLLLTGTPLQNNLGELISLLKFIMPAYFRGAEEALGQIFKVNHQSQLSKERVSRAKKMMQPFVLRRKKVDVLLDLKPKTEVIKYCDMTADQSRLYKEAFAKSKAALRQQQDEAVAIAAKSAGTRGAKSAAANRTKSGHVLMELRKAANHPLLFRRLYTDRKIEALARDYLKNAEHADEDLAMKREDFSINSDAELSMSVAAQYKSCHKHMLEAKEWLNSGKIAALKEVIAEAASQGERLIIFSQFVQTLEIICRALEVMDVSYRGFTGSTDVDSRQEIVDEFTRDASIQCFLLSTRAGGVGINLTAANWVVLFDQDFNPQNDRQAADRAYRIGQTKQVTIVRLISKNTIDEQILELGKSKLKLAERVEGGDEDADESASNQDEVEARVEQTLLASLANADEEDEEVKGSPM